jgi:tetratricopeptide (TPR) repeat protein
MRETDRARAETRLVSRKGKYRHPAPTSPVDLRQRIDRATREGRFQQALELAKHLYKYEPTADHKSLLLEIYLGRARQLRNTGYTRDAITVLNAGLVVDSNNTAWLEKAAAELAACGDARTAQTLLARLPSESPARARITGLAVDAALAQEAAGRSALPPELHADFDRVLQAFAQVQAGQDEPARETLQAISLRSPFLEWKVLLRGLIAYHQGDDARALDNWQRLSADRLPARLAAPFRYLVDSAYRNVQTPEAQAALRKQADRLQADGFIEPLRAVQVALGHRDSLARAFRLAEGLLPALRQHSPQLAARLASCYYWAVVHEGEPEDVPRYARVFGAPPDDPTFARLRALACEGAGALHEAHKEWQKFEKAVAAHPGTWPAGQAERVRALVWSHMGSNAAAAPDLDGLELPPFLRNHADRPRPLHPTAEHCFEESLKLAPDVLETHDRLVSLYQGQHKSRKAEQAARRLLERFPDHVATIETLADLRMEACDYAEGISLLQRAMRLDPLDRNLRRRLSRAHLFHARAHAEAEEFETARAEFQAALTLSERADNSSVYCKWAACEFKAGNVARAEELLAQALADVGSRLGIAYSMLIEVIRLRLPKLKKRFNDEFNAQLAQAADAASAASMADTAAAHKTAGVTYHGQKTHEKKVHGYLQKALGTPMTEQQMDRVCAALLRLEESRLLGSYSHLGHTRYPKSPYFPFYEAESYIMLGPYRCPVYQVRHLFGEVRRLAQDLPPDSRREALLETVRHREEMIGTGGPLGGLNLDMFGSPFSGPDEDEYSEDEDGW